MTVESEAMIANLCELYAGTNEATREAGRRWYPAAARELSVTRYGLRKAASVAAALSPQVRWEENLRSALRLMRWRSAGASRRSLMRRRGIASFRAQRRKAVAILEGADPATVLRGPKESAFARAIAGDHEAITVDRHAAFAAGLARTTGDLTPKRLAQVQDAYWEAARLCGETPRNFQAIAWLAVRPASGQLTIGGTEA